MGLSYTRIEDYRLEIEAYKKAIQLDSVNYSAVGNLGWAYYCANDFDSCILYSQKAIRINEKAYFARFQHSAGYIETGKNRTGKGTLYHFLDQINKTKDDNPEISYLPVGAAKDLQNLLDKNIQVDEVNDILKKHFWTMIPKLKFQNHYKFTMKIKFTSLVIAPFPWFSFHVVRVKEPPYPARIFRIAGI